MATLTATRPPSSSNSKARSTPSKRKKGGDQRTEIWSNLLRQTGEAQARSRTSQALQSRELIVCGGSPDDQRQFVERCVARPPPAQPAAARNRDQKTDKRKGEVRLSNLYAYGYGHVTLFSPPAQQGAGMGMLGNEAEEVARVEVHTLPEPEAGYEATLRRLLRAKKGQQSDIGEGMGEVTNIEQDEEGEGRRPAVCILLSWKEPWVFLDQLRRWLQLLSAALSPDHSSKRNTSETAETLSAYGLQITLVLHHTEAQESLLRELYTEESFDYISQTLRTCILPLSGALVYTSSVAAPQTPGSALSEVQKVVYSSLGLDIGALQTKTRPGSAGTGSTGKKEELLPKHNIVDRMAVVVPSEWDSVGKIRLMSENFSPEAVLEGWMTDLAMPFVPPKASEPQELEITNEIAVRNDGEDPEELQANGGAEYHYSPQPASTPDPPLSPSRQARSAITSYEQSIQDPSAHKKPQPPAIEVTTKPEQHFLAEMRTALQGYEEQDRDRARREPGLVNTTAGAIGGNNSRSAGVGADGGATGGGSALSGLGDVSFNVGGISYDTVSAEAAIERLKRPQPSSSSGGGDSPTVSTPRASTPRPPKGAAKREQREDGASGSRESSSTPAAPTPSTSGKGPEVPIEKLEEYFYSLMKRGGGIGGSASSTPSKAPQ